MTNFVIRAYPLMYRVGGFFFIDPIQESKMTRGYIHIETIPNIKIQPINPMRNAILTQVVTGSISNAKKSKINCPSSCFLKPMLDVYRA